jgi:diguanylate cyclase (GGDEF)-like protein
VSSATVRAIIEACQDALFLVESSAQGILTLSEANHAALILSGLTLETLSGTALVNLPLFSSHPDLILHFQEVLLTGNTFDQDYELHCSGQSKWMHIRAVPAENLLAITLQDNSLAQQQKAAYDLENERIRQHLEDKNTELRRHIQTQFATLEVQAYELKELNTRLFALSTVDALTELKNYRAFQERLNEEFQRVLRYREPLSLIMIDVDNFKEYNDTFGHPAGDRVLQHLAHLMQDAQRSADMVARYGGEEFVIIMPETDTPGAMEAAERIRRTVEQEPWSLHPITISIGVTSITETTKTPTQLLEEADRALYASKKQGRNRVTLYSASPDLT